MTPKKIKTSRKIILITGCSSGFGLLTAAHLASKGHKVYASMRNLNKKAALLNEVKKRGGKVEILELDVTNSESIHNAIQHIAETDGYIDVLVNNAGYAIGGFFEDLSEEDIRAQMETNFFGVQNLTREIIPLMRVRRSGKIINISSVAGFSASPAFGAYNSSKWALEAFSESLRYELKLFGIDVLLIQPGVYKTPIFYENRKNGLRFGDPNSPYFEISQTLSKKVNDFVEDCHKDPNDIAFLVEKLIHAKHPSFRNIPDLESKVQYALRKILPFRIYSWIIQRFFMKGIKNNNA